MINKKLYRYLTLSGTLPFLISSLLLLLNFQSIWFFGDLTNIFSSYSLLIISFMSGILWGQYLHLENSIGDKLAILGNIIVIAVWALFLLIPFKIMVIAYGLTFLFLMYIDIMLFKQEVIDKDYLNIRYIATIIVSISMVMAFIGG